MSCSLLALRSQTLLLASSFCLLTASLLSGCKSETQTTTTSQPAPKNLVATSYMLAHFAETLAVDGMQVSFPIPADVDPAHWHPTEEDVAALQQADLLIINGSTYESWLDSISIDDEKILNTTVALSDQLIESGEEVTHSHGPEGEHSHAGTASQLWLDPALAVRQAGTLETSLAERLQVEARTELAAKSVVLNKKLVEFESSFEDKTEACRGWAVIASHPVYQYLGRRLDWKLSSVHWEPGETPSEEEFTALQSLVESTGAKLMIWEGEPTAETRTRVEAMGLTIAVYDPCFQKPEDGDWFTVMQANVDRLAAAIKTIGAQPE